MVRTPFGIIFANQAVTVCVFWNTFGLGLKDDRVALDKSITIGL